MEQVRKFGFDVGWGLVSSIVTLPIAFLLRIVLARWLGAADLGLYTMVVTILGIATIVATFGISVAVIKYTAEYQDDKDKLTQIVSSGFVNSIIFGVVAGIFLYALSGIIAGLFHMPELARLLKILGFALPFLSLFETVLGSLNGLREMKTYAYLIVLRSLLMITFIVALVKLGFGVEGAVFGIVLSVVGGCIFGLYLSRKFLRLNLRNYTQNAKRLISFGGRVLGGNTVSLLAEQADIIMIGYFLAAKDVGYYSVAVSLSMLFLIIPQAIQRITYPATSEYWSKNNYQALQTMIDKSMKYPTCILLPIGLGVGFFSKEIVTTVFGGEFICAALPLCVLLIARVIRGGTTIPVGGSLGASGRPELNLMINSVAMATNIGLNILLIPPLGILGAAIATTISLLLWTAIFFVLVIRILHIKIDFKWFSVAIGSAGIAVALFLVGIKLINRYVLGGVILCSYAILVFKLFLTKEDRAMFGSLTHSLVSRR